MTMNDEVFKEMHWFQSLLDHEYLGSPMSSKDRYKFTCNVTNIIHCIDDDREVRDRRILVRAG